MKDSLVGKVFETNSSGLCVVIDYKDSKQILVRFLDTGHQKIVNSSNLKKGLIKDCSINHYREVVGKIFETKKFGKFKIVNYENANDVTIMFENTGYIRKTKMKHVYTGNVPDLSVPTCYGVGIIGEFVCMGSFHLNEKTHKLWNRMLERCYSEKSTHRSPTYVDCFVSDKFKILSEFKTWCNAQVGFNSKDEKGNSFQLDKDILVKGNKIYSEETCCFVPQEINGLFAINNKRRGNCPIGVTFNSETNLYVARLTFKKSKKVKTVYCQTELEAFQAYKQAKEAHIKEVANKWKDKIDHRVYEALMNYQVEITD